MRLFPILAAATIGLLATAAAAQQATTTQSERGRMTTGPDAPAVAATPANPNQPTTTQSAHGTMTTEKPVATTGSGKSAAPVPTSDPANRTHDNPHAYGHPNKH